MLFVCQIILSVRSTVFSLHKDTRVAIPPRITGCRMIDMHRKSETVRFLLSYRITSSSEFHKPINFFPSELFLIRLPPPKIFLEVYLFYSSSSSPRSSCHSISHSSLRNTWTLLHLPDSVPHPGSGSRSFPAVPLHPGPDGSLPYWLR